MAKRVIKKDFCSRKSVKIFVSYYGDIVLARVFLRQIEPSMLMFLFLKIGLGSSSHPTQSGGSYWAVRARKSRIFTWAVQPVLRGVGAAAWALLGWALSRSAPRMSWRSQQGLRNLGTCTSFEIYSWVSGTMCVDGACGGVVAAARSFEVQGSGGIAIHFYG